MTGPVPYRGATDQVPDHTATAPVPDHGATGSAHGPTGHVADEAITEPAPSPGRPHATPRSVPIGDYGLIGDTRSAALVAPDGAIDWWCAPRFDDPPLFARLVAGDDGGHFRIGPREPVRSVTRAYLPGTATLVTTWRLDGAELELSDALVGEVEGRFLPGTLLVRTVTARGRPVDVAIELAPRFGYELRPAAVVRRRNGALLLSKGDLATAVCADGVDLVPDRPSQVTVAPGADVVVALSLSRRGPLIIVPPERAAEARLEDERRWRHWSAGLRVPEEYRDVVTRSLITLRLLTYSPSGAPVAAPTTSLPELIGGSRNWDYRFAWPRDASIGITAFLTAGQDREARAFLAWLLHASRLTRPRLPVLFTVLGRPGPPERVLDGWPGYADSPPVRRGNGARNQHQLDGYGWVVHGAWVLASTGYRLYPETWRTMSGYADRVAEIWRQPDAGIWEKRAPHEHHVHSKLMAWVALDRAVRIAVLRGEGRRPRARRWVAQRDAVAAEIRSKGLDPGLGHYTAAFGRSDLDSALLLLPGMGFDPPTSPAVARTVDAVRAGLTAGGPLVYRYDPGNDGLVGGEGAFLPCSFWLVEALARTGRRDEAKDLFDALLGLGGPLGLYGEEMDPVTHEHLGNYPQALTHAGLIQAAFALSGAVERML
jgi:GH15 family glucan-1,4-alpha-glucosidase